MDVLKGLPALLMLLVTAKVVPGDVCKSGKFTTTDEKCCSMCPRGYGVSVPCGESDTQCEPCTGSTYSDKESATEKCQPCSECRGAHCPSCHCPGGHFLLSENATSGVCHPCSVCGRGEGVLVNCTRTRNTVCQTCSPGFYSEVKSSVSPCMPCRAECNETEVQISQCTTHRDLVCMVRDLAILKRTEGEVRRDDLGTPGTAGTDLGTPEFTSPEDSGKNIIPVYCSILAAVVVGLIAYVAFKCWTSCKQKKLLAKARAGELAASGEGEKLHSDSGVFLDTHSLQEQNQLNKAAKLEPKLYVNLPPHKQEEVERLLADTSRGKDWQRLASLLGYEEDTIDAFSRGEDPVHTLLTDWSSKESSTLEVLCAALVNMERADVVENLNNANDASSVV